jgi:hypothetical protein
LVHLPYKLTKGGVGAALDDLEAAKQDGGDRLSPYTGPNIEERVTTKYQGPEGHLGAKEADVRYSSLDDRKTDELDDDKGKDA